MAGGQRGRPKKVVHSSDSSTVESEEIIEDNGDFSPNNVLLDPVQLTPPTTPTRTTTAPPALPTFKSEDLTKLGAYF